MATLLRNRWQLSPEYALPGQNVINVFHSYNAILSAAQVNHPHDAFLSALKPLEKSGNTIELAIMFSQLRIALEASNVEESE